jgi:Icc-related predicted phosphoesterase
LYGTKEEKDIFETWVEKQCFNLKLVIAGNHDFVYEDPNERKLNGCVFLDETEYIYEGVKFYGSPWTPKFGPFVFMKPRNQLYDIWDKIPDDTDILITHGPPRRILDYVGNGEYVGDVALREKIAEVNPKLHVFGHIHPEYGVVERAPTVFINAAVSNDALELVNPPKIVDFIVGEVVDVR